MLLKCPRHPNIWQLLGVFSQKLGDLYSKHVITMRAVCLFLTRQCTSGHSTLLLDIICFSPARLIIWCPHLAPLLYYSGTESPRHKAFFEPIKWILAPAILSLELVYHCSSRATSYSVHYSTVLSRCWISNIKTIMSNGCLILGNRRPSECEQAKYIVCSKTQKHR